MASRFTTQVTLAITLGLLASCTDDASPSEYSGIADSSSLTDTATATDTGSSQADTPPLSTDVGTRGADTTTALSPILLGDDEGTALVEPAFFEPIFGPDQPFEQPTEGACDSPLQFEPEPEFNGFWFSIETLGCNHGTVKTTLKHAVKAGQLLVVRFFHFTIVRGDGDWALRLSIGSSVDNAEEVHVITSAVPAPTNVIRSEWVAARDYAAGETLWWNASNHGLNSWSFMSLRAFTPTDTCGLSDSVCAQQPNCAFLGECSVTEACRCVPVQNANCEASTLCELYGLCGAHQSRCIAVDDSACADSVHCEEDGLCKLAGEECLATTDTLCKEALVCLNGGKCTSQDGHCIAATDSDCESADICSFSGQCSAVDGICIAANDQDCAQSDGCQYQGQCTARDGLCVKQ